MPIFRGAKMKRWGIFLSVLLLASMLLTACGNGNGLSILDPQGPVADKEAGLFWFILVVATVVFVAVETILIVSIIRYRERPNSPMPKQIHGNNTIEILWTVAPSIFLFAVLIGTIYTMFGLNQPAGQAIDVKVVAHQWWWQFTYEDNGNITTADELVVPIGRTIHLDLESQNVIHSFWIPELTGKTDVIPGHNNTKWFQANTPGTYPGECAEFCGLEHAEMKFSVIAKPYGDYMTWLSSQQQAAQKPTDPTALAGMQFFMTAGGCTGCHGIVGVDLKSFNDPTAQVEIGPNLTHFGSRDLIAGGVLSWNPGSCMVSGSGSSAQIANEQKCGLWEWLHDPQAIKPGNDMHINQLTDTQIAQLVAYLESLT